MTRPSENTKDILVIYEEEAKEWALYLESLFKHIIKEESILLYNLDTSSIQHLESFSLSCYRCKLLILTNGLLRCLNQKRSYFLHRVLEPPGKVVILLCGVENSHILYEMLTLDQSSQEISTDLEPEEYLSIVAGIIQQDERQKEEAEESLSYIYETVLADDYQAKSEVNLQLDRGVSVKTDVSLKTEEVSETLETARPSVLVLPTRISCENPGEIFILLRDEITETVEIEFITDNQRIRTQPAFWNQKVRFMKAVDFPAGHVNVNVYCGGVIKAVTQIEYYTAVEEIERIFKEVADPIAFACQAFKFTSVEKLDSTLTFLLKSKLSVSEFGAFPNEEHHQQANSHLEELPTLLHCAAKFGLKNLANLLLQCPEASQACRIANKHGENPAHIAGKHGHKELQIIIQELSIHAVDSEDGLREQEEEEVEDGIYVAMLSSDPHVTSSLTDKQSPGDQCRDRQKAWEESGKKEEDDEEEEKEEAEEDMGVEEKEDEENNLEESSYTSGDSNDNLYASIPDYDPEADGRDFLFSDKPPLPPREPPITIKQNDLYYLSQAGKLVEERNKKDETSGHLEAYGGAEDKSEEEEEDPYTFANEDESVYDMILASDVEKRKERGSLIINRPPAPAPRPLCSPVKEENTPYIVQGLDDVFRQIASSTTCSVFQQKATRIHSDNEKMYSAVRKQDRVPTETSAYATVRHSIPSGQEELILLQEQVKKGTITVDEALEKFKQWQTEKSRLEVTQKEKVRQLRNTIIGNRPEEEILYDKITIEHHPHVSKESRRESLPFKDMMYDTTFNKLAPPRNPSEKEQMPKDN